jgi:hypothetical protein
MVWNADLARRGVVHVHVRIGRAVGNCRAINVSQGGLGCRFHGRLVSGRHNRPSELREDELLASDLAEPQGVANLGVDLASPSPLPGGTAGPQVLRHRVQLEVALADGAPRQHRQRFSGLRYGGGVGSETK